MFTKEELDKMNFVADDWKSDEKNGSVATRPSGKHMPLSNDMKQVYLRQKMSEYFVDRFDKNYNAVEARCMINIETFKALLNGKRPVKRRMLAKFCIGMKATLEEADEMMALQGHHLEKDNYRMDYILTEALKDRIDIQKYYDWGEEFHFDPDKWN